jgi:hypothetical protein
MDSQINKLNYFGFDIVRNELCEFDYIGKKYLNNLMTCS